MARCRRVASSPKVAATETNVAIMAGACSRNTAAAGRPSAGASRSMMTGAASSSATAVKAPAISASSVRRTIARSKRAVSSRSARARRGKAAVTAIAGSVISTSTTR